MAIIVYAHFHQCEQEIYRQLFAPMGDLTPVVQALPPQAALLDLSGAVRYFDLHPTDLAQLLQLRVLARFGVTTTLGIGPNRLLATLAAHTVDRGNIEQIPDDPQAITAFLAPLPVRALPDVGPALERTLASYGLTTLADLHALPLPTLQRITSTATGRLLAERAAGRDPRTVQPQGPPATINAHRTFDHDTTSPHTTRRALLAVAVELGARLRTSGQVTRRLDLEVRYADRTTTTRSRTLTEATDHTATLQQSLYALFDSLALQRARLRSIAVRAQGLAPVESASVQLTFDRPTELKRTLEPTIDRVLARFGAQALTPAALAPPPARRGGVQPMIGIGADGGSAAA
jgi:DNA polymerase-4